MTAPLVLDAPTAAHAPRVKRSVLRVVIALVVGCLTLAGVIGVGWYVSSDEHAAASASNTLPYAVPSQAWTDGAQQVWELGVAADAEVLTVGNHLITIEREGKDDRSAVLVGYEVSESGATQVWTAIADLTVGNDGGVPFQIWDGSTLVHGTTLINLATGEISTAPWSATELPLVLDDRVISCASNHPCRAWAPGVDTPVWSMPDANLFGLSEDDIGRVPVLHRSGQRYAVVGSLTAVNIDTGAPVLFDMPMLASWVLLSTAEGWVIVARDSDGDGQTVYEFDLGGGAPVNSYAVTSPLPEGQVALMSSDPLTREDLRSLLDGDHSSALGWATRENPTGHCFVAVQRGDGPSIELPTAPVQQGNVIAANSSCRDDAVVSPEHDLVVVREESRLTANAFSFLYDGATGTRIEFAGTDPMGGNTFSLVTEDLVVGYDAGSGTVRGYAPGGASRG